MLQVMPMKSSYLGKSATHGLAWGTLWVAKSEMTRPGSLIENAFRRRHRRRGDCTAFPACEGAPAAERSREGGEGPGDAAHAPLSGTPRAPSEPRGRCPPDNRTRRPAAVISGMGPRADVRRTALMSPGHPRRSWARHRGCRNCNPLASGVVSGQTGWALGARLPVPSSLPRNA
jgi:hypothetical protein